MVFLLYSIGVYVYSFVETMLSIIMYRTGEKDVSATTYTEVHA
jgi:hypothetical protein